MDVEESTADLFAQRLPRKDILPLAALRYVCITVTIIALAYFGSQTYIARLNLDARTNDDGRSERFADADNSANAFQAESADTAQPVHAPTGEGMQSASHIRGPFDVPGNRSPASGAARAANQIADGRQPEPMVRESFVRFVVDALARKDEMSARRDEFWGRELEKRDRLIDGLSVELAQLRGQFNEQRQELLAVRKQQLQKAWAQVDQFRREATLGVRFRNNSIQVEGEQPPGGADTHRPDDPFAKPGDPFGDGMGRIDWDNVTIDPPPTVNAGESTVDTRSGSRVRTRRLGAYRNVSPHRSSGGDGPAAGTAAARLETEQARHEAAIRWTREYYGGSASRRLLREAEAGHR